MALAKSLLKKWDFRFGSHSTAASVFNAWEFMITYYLHEKKITSPVARVVLSHGEYVGQFVWVSIREWAHHMRTTGETTRAEYCAVNEIPGDDCLNFMVYTFIKGVEDIEGRLGPFDAGQNNWRYGLLTHTRYEH